MWTEARIFMSEEEEDKITRKILEENEGGFKYLAEEKPSEIQRSRFKRFYSYLKEKLFGEDEVEFGKVNVS